MNLEFVPCEALHLEVLVEVSKSTFRSAFEEQNNPDDFKTYLDQAFSKKRLCEEMANPNMHFYFVYLNGELAAYFKLNLNDAQTDVKREDSMELERIYVLDQFQGRQLGKHILNWVKSRASEYKKEFIWLGVWEKNERAIAFYERNGFSKFGTHPYYIGNDKQTDWLMRLDID